VGVVPVLGVGAGAGAGVVGVLAVVTGEGAGAELQANEHTGRQEGQQMFCSQRLICHSSLLQQQAPCQASSTFLWLI
jgi:hypothetical protein